MAYADNQNTFMFILNKNWEPAWQLHNARGHVAVGLGATIGQAANLLGYEIPALEMTAQISHWPVVDKAAKEAEINRLYLELKEANAQGDDFVMNVFTDSMFGTSAEDQLAQTRNAKEPKILVIGLFGKSDVLKQLTKRLKLASF